MVHRGAGAVSACTEKELTHEHDNNDADRNHPHNSDYFRRAVGDESRQGRDSGKTLLAVPGLSKYRVAIDRGGCRPVFD